MGQIGETYEKEKATLDGWDDKVEPFKGIKETYESNSSWLLFGLIMFSILAFCFACMVICGR